MGKSGKRFAALEKQTASVPPLCKRQKFCETLIKSQSRQLGWMLPDLLRYNKAKATIGGLSSLHNRFAGDIQPHAVGKRTPRFPVKYSDAEECGRRATPKADQDSRESCGDQALHWQYERIAAEALCALANLPERCMHVKNEIGISAAAGHSNTPGFEFAKSTSGKISDSSSLQKTERKALLPCCKLIPEQKDYDFQPSVKTWKMKRPTAAKEVKFSTDAGCEPQSPKKTLFITYRRRAKVKDISCMLLEPVNIIPRPIRTPYSVSSSLYSTLHGSKLELIVMRVKLRTVLLQISPVICKNLILGAQARELAVGNNGHPHLDCFSSLGTGWSESYLDLGTQPLLDIDEANSTNCKTDLTDSKHMMHPNACKHLPINYYQPALQLL